MKLRIKTFAALLILAALHNSSLADGWRSANLRSYTGDYNRDGRPDIYLKAVDSLVLLGIEISTPVTLKPPFESILLLSDGSRFTTLYNPPAAELDKVTWQTTPYQSLLADVNGDGLTDLLLQPNESGTDLLLVSGNPQSQGILFQRSPQSLGTDIHYNAGVRFNPGDWNRDGRVDFRISHPQTGLTDLFVNASSELIARHVYTPSADATIALGEAPQDYSALNLGLPNASVSNGGDAQYSYPIALPEGINGVRPSLGISYAGAGQSGILGRGWGLAGLSTIHRCGNSYVRDGGNAPVGLAAGDKLCLDGMRLHLVSGTHLQPGSEYRAELTDFSKITLKGTASALIFEVKTRSNQTLTYGGGSASIKTQGKVAEYLWAIRSQKDSFGNEVLYNYVTPADTLMPSSITYADTEIGFTYQNALESLPRYIGGGFTQGDKILSAIDISAASKPRASLKLAYSSALDSPKAVVLNSLQECRQGESGQECLHPVGLDYEKQALTLVAGNSFSTTSPLPRGVGQSDSLTLDWNGDGISDMAATSDISGARTIVVSSPNKDGSLSTQTIYSGVLVVSLAKIDHDSDGRDEVLFLAINSSSGSTWNVQWKIATKDGVFPASEAWSTQNSALMAQFSPGFLAHLMVRGSTLDANNDGKTDLLLPVGGQWQVYLNNQASAGAPSFSKTTRLSGFDTATYGWLTPFGADPAGGTQLITQKNGTLHGARLATTGTTTSASLVSLGAPMARSASADLNGDGLTDFVIPENNNTLSVLLNTGGSLSSTLFRKITTSYSSAQVLPVFKYRGSESDYSTRAIDLDQDGRQELLYYNSDGKLHTLRFTGAGFETSSTGLSPSRVLTSNFNALSQSCKDTITLWQRAVSNARTAQDRAAAEAALYMFGAIPCGYNLGGQNMPDPMEIEIGDFTGNGFSSLALATPITEPGQGGTVRYKGANWKFYRQTRTLPELLTKVDQGTGNTATFQYAQLNDAAIHTPAASASFPNMLLRAGKPVVRQLLLSNGVGGSNTQRFSYAGALFNRQGYGFLGLSSIKVEDLARDNAYTERTLNQSFPFIGTVQQEETYLGGQRISRATHTWDQAKSVGDKVRFAFISQSIEEQFEDGTATRASQTNNSYDTTYGNLESTSVRQAANAAGLASPLHTRTLSRSYSNDTANWWLGFLTQEVETNTSDGKSRSRTHGYTRMAAHPLVESEVRFKGVAALEQRISYERDANGRLLSRKVESDNSALRTVSYGSYQGPYAGTETNALGHVQTRSYDRFSGQPTRVTDANGLVTRSSYDAFGRLLKQLNPDGSQSLKQYHLCSQSLLCPSNAKVAEQTQTLSADGSQRGAPEQWLYQDGLGREVRQRPQTFSGGWAKVDSVYDGLGRKTKTTEPHSAAATWLETTWDSQDRPKARQLPGGASLSYSYGARAGGGSWRQYSLTYDQNGSQTRTERRETNALGQLALSVNAVGSSQETRVEYDYNPDGDLTWTRINGDARTDITMGYDLAGNRAFLEDPNSGRQTMAYNAHGELLKVTASDGSTISHSYDALGRRTQRSDHNASGQLQERSTWTYDEDTDALGALSGMSQQQDDNPPGFTQVYGYDSFARLNNRLTNISVDGQPNSYEDSYGYDGFSRPLILRDASGLRLQHDYNGYGYASGETNLADGKPLRTIDSQDLRGQVTQVTYGNGVVTQNDYDDATGWLQRIQSTGRQGNSLQDLSYRYAQNGLLLNRSDARGYSEDFDYDILQRLTQSSRTLNGQLLAGSYAYDGLGNLTANPQSGTLDYGSYDDQGAACQGKGVAAPGPHAVLKSASGYYCYDARGNQLSGPGRAVSYSLYDKPLSIAAGGQTSTFAYDPERRRYLQKSARRTTLYLDEGQLEDIRESGSTGSRRLQNRYFGGYLQYQKNLTANTSQLIYQLRDQLGSVEASVNASSVLLERHSYTPFGGVRDGNWGNGPSPLLTTRRGFTDHEHLPDSGLIHMNGRVYDPALGRFLSADIVYQDTANAQMFNRYAYGFNSPFSGVDPTGHFWTKADGGMYGGYAQITGPANPYSSREFEDLLNISDTNIIVGGINSLGKSAFFKETDTFLKSYLSGSQCPNCHSGAFIRPEISSFNSELLARDFSGNITLQAGLSIVEIPLGAAAGIGVSALKLSALTSRLEYLRRADDITDMANSMRAAGLTAEQSSRLLHPIRNEIKLQVRAEGDFWLARYADIRNLFVYKNRAGPSLEFLLEKNKGSWEKLFQSLGKTSNKYNSMTGAR